MLADADRHGDGSEPQYRKQHGREREAVAEQHGDTVAAGHAQTLEAGRPGINDPLEASVIEPLIPADDGFPIGIAGDRLGEKGIGAFWPLCEAAHDTAVEVPLCPQRRHGSEP